MASPTATGARTSWSAYSRSVGTSTSGSTWLWSPKLARAIARKPPGRNARALSMDVATSSPSADGENIDGTIAAANSSGGNPDACSERASRCFASSAPSEPRQPASRPGAAPPRRPCGSQHRPQSSDPPAPACRCPATPAHRSAWSRSVLLSRPRRMGRSERALGPVGCLPLTIYVLHVSRGPSSRRTSPQARAWECGLRRMMPSQWTGATRRS
jgi:hypothetical protein